MNIGEKEWCLTQHLCINDVSDGCWPGTLKIFPVVPVHDAEQMSLRNL